MFCKADRDKIRCTVDVILFLRRYHPFPPSLINHAAKITERELFQSKNEELMSQLTHYLYWILNPVLCAKHIRWPTTNRKQFFQDVQTYLVAVSKESRRKQLPKAKSSSLCFPTTSKDYEYQISFIFMTVLVVMTKLIEQTGKGSQPPSSTGPLVGRLELQKTEEARAIKQLVFSYHRHNFLIKRIEKLKELHGKAKGILTRFVDLVNLPVDDKTKIKYDHQAIKEYIAPIIVRKEKLIGVKNLVVSIQHELEEIKARRLDAKSLLIMISNTSLQKLSVNNNINLYNDDRLSLTGLFQLHRLVIEKQIGLLNLVTNSPFFELLRRQKDRLFHESESMIRLTESLTERLVEKESSVFQIREDCLLMKREQECRAKPTVLYRPSFSLQDSLRFSNSIFSYSPVTGFTESGNSVIENVRKGLENSKSTTKSRRSNSDSPAATVLHKRWMLLNGSISDPFNESAQLAPFSSSSPTSNYHREEGYESTHSFKEDAFNLIDDVIPELRLESFHCSGISDNDQDASDGDEFEQEKFGDLSSISSPGTPRDDVISRYLEIRRRVQI